MKRRRVRITVLLMSAIGGLVFISAMLVLVLSARTGFRNTVELLHEAGNLTISALERDISAHVRPVHDIVTQLADMTADGTIHPDRPEAFNAALHGALAAAPQVSGLVFWSIDGAQREVVRNATGNIIVLDSTGTTPPVIAELLRQDLSEFETRWRRPTGQDGIIYINVVASVLHDGRTLGVLAAGVALAALSEFVAAAGEDIGMTAFILYGPDHVLAHPEIAAATPAAVAESDAMPSIENLQDGVLRQFSATQPQPHLSDVGIELREIDWQGDRHLVLSRTSWSFGATGWHIGVHAPLDDINTQMVRLFASIVAGLGVVIFAIVAGILLARYIARPILSVSSSAEQIGRLELAGIEPLPKSRIRELDDQASAFNRMVEALRWFETYVPKRLVQRLISSDQTTGLASREVDLTVMFTDIIGFTARSEAMAPADVGTMLNRHFEIIARCIEAEGGTIDKYIGDATMAFWGAPENQPDHAERACRAALAIAREIAADTRHEGDPLRLKIALHSGPLLVGNIGASARMNYTVIGDTVNVCARIEDLCSRIDDGESVIVLASEATLERARNAGIAHEAVGKFEVKGRREPIAVSRLRTS